MLAKNLTLLNARDTDFTFITTYYVVFHFHRHPRSDSQQNASHGGQVHQLEDVRQADGHGCCTQVYASRS